MSGRRERPSTGARETQQRGSGLLVLGITGGIGSGKSTAARMFERRGARVLDADEIVRELYDGGELPRRIEKRFGPGMLTSRGAVNRRALGRVVFADARARADLEALVHPQVRRRVQEKIEQWREEGFEGIVVIDAALLVEAREAYPLDALIVVTAPSNVRFSRLEKRGMSRSEASRRVQAQSSDEIKLESADFRIDNSGGLKELERAIERILRDLGRDGGGASE